MKMAKEQFSRNAFAPFGKTTPQRRSLPAAFTLLEIVIVLIVLGILVSIGLPTQVRIAEKARTTDGKTALTSIRHAQMRYYASYSVYADDLAKLDIDADSKYYILSTGLGTEVSCGNATRNLSIEGGILSSPYTLSISADGNLSITPGFEYLL